MTLLIPVRAVSGRLPSCGHPHPNPLPEGEGVGGRPNDPPHPSTCRVRQAAFMRASQYVPCLHAGTLTTLSQRERGSEGAPMTLPIPVRAVSGRLPSCGHPHPNPLPEGEGVGGRPNDPPASQYVPCPAGPFMRAPSPQPSPRGRGGRRAPNDPPHPSTRRVRQAAFMRAPSPQPSPRGRGGRRVGSGHAVGGRGIGCPWRKLWRSTYSA